MDVLLFYGSLTLDYLAQMLPCALAAGLLFLCLRPRRLARLAARGLESGPWREGALLLFVLFCAGLGALTLFPANFWTVGHWRGALAGNWPLFRLTDPIAALGHGQWRPFWEISLAFGGRWRAFMVLANALIFIPMGLFPALLGRRPKWWRAMLTGFAASLTVETVQLFVGRESDVDDIILNTAGALLGYWIFLLLRRAAPAFTGKFQLLPKEEFQNGREPGDTAAPR